MKTRTASWRRECIMSSVDKRTISRHWRGRLKWWMGSYISMIRRGNWWRSWLRRWSLKWRRRRNKFMLMGRSWRRRWWPNNIRKNSRLCKRSILKNNCSYCRNINPHYRIWKLFSINKKIATPYSTKKINYKQNSLNNSINISLS